MSVRRIDGSLGAPRPSGGAPGTATSLAAGRTGVRSVLGRALARVHTELAANPRLRAGAWAVATILLVQGLLLQSDRLSAAHDAYAESASRLAHIQGLTSDVDWAALLTAEQARAEALTERFWQAETPGLAQARLQAALTEMTSDLPFRNPIVQAGISRPVPEAPGLWQAQAQFSGLAQDGAELEVLRAIAQWPRKLVIDRLQVRRRDQRLTVLLSAYFVGVEAPEAVAEAG